MSKPTIDTDPFANFYKAMDVASGVVRSFSEQLASQSRRMGWELRVTFADSEKERRRIRRDMARAYRSPSLIHKGGKP